MKRIMLFVAIVAVATSASVQAQETETIETIETIQFINQIGCELSYKVADLADIIANSDTLYVEFDDYEDNELARLMAEYENTFPSELGADEPAVSILVPDDDYFNVIFLQETEEGEILTLRILSEGGWLECVAGDEELLQLADMIAFIQHLIEVSSSE